MTVDLDVVTSLGNANTIELVEETLLFEWH